MQDHHSPRDGRFIENLGSFEPRKGGDSIQVKRSRLEYWLSVGAQMSDSVRNRLKKTLKTEPSPENKKPAVRSSPKKEASQATPL